MINNKVFSKKVFNKKALNKKILKGLISAAILASLSTLVFAEEVITFDGKKPSSNELMDAFLGSNKPQQTQEINDPVMQQRLDQLMPTGGSKGGGMKFRGISKKKKKNTAVASASACMAGNKPVALQIQFNSNSTEINAEDSHTLENLASVMNSPNMKNCFFVIEGHTDARGEAYYNLWLSQKRAESVKHTLKNNNIDGERLIVVGKGEDELLNTAQPNASDNRRVQFRVVNPVK